MLKDKNLRRKVRKANAHAKQMRRRASPKVMNLDAFRRLRFEATLRERVRPFYNAVPTPALIRRIRKTIQKVIIDFARSRQLAKRLSVLVEFDAESETLTIGYWKDGLQIHVYNVYDAINPGSKKIVGMHVGAQGNPEPVMEDESHPTALGALMLDGEPDP